MLELHWRRSAPSGMMSGSSACACRKTTKMPTLKSAPWPERLGIKLRQQPTPRNLADQAVVDAHARHMARLETLSGVAFDKDFVTLMTRSHQSSVQALEHQRVLLPHGFAGAGSFNAAASSTLRDHYQIAATLGGVPN